MKSQYFTQIPQHELVRMAVAGLKIVTHKI